MSKRAILYLVNHMGYNDEDWMIIAYKRLTCETSRWYGE